MDIDEAAQAVWDRAFLFGISQSYLYIILNQV